MAFLEWIMIVLIGVGIFTFFTWILSGVKATLATFVVNGNKQEVYNKMHKILLDHKAKIITNDASALKITIYGLSRIIKDPTYKLDGNMIDFNFKYIQSQTVEIEVVSYRTLSFHFIYTKDEWERYGYDESIITRLVKEIN